MRDWSRYEHAWLLRAEGVTLNEIGSRLGVSGERARQMIAIFGRRVAYAVRWLGQPYQRGITPLQFREDVAHTSLVQLDLSSG